MTTEEKAKRYEEALERAKKVLETDLHESGAWAIKKIFPELKESEDERIIHAIIDALYSHTNSINLLSSRGYQMEDIEAWLEKQKEQKPLEYLPKEKVYDIMSKLTNLSFSILFPINSEEYRKIGEITSDVRDLLDYPIEQKSAEWSEDFEENIRNLLHDKLTGHSKDGTITWTTFIDDKTLRDIVSGIWFYVGKEALKYPNKELNVAEWNEEDKAIIGCIVCCLDGQFVTDAARKQCLEWFNKHRRDFLNQTKQEWSEEDEKKRNLLIDILEVNHPNGYFKVNPINTLDMEAMHVEELVDWLKSLRPQPKQDWSDEDKNKLNHILEIVHIASGREASVDEKEELESFLKSLKPQPKQD